MKRKGPVVDLKSFLEKAAAKKRAQEQTQTNLNPSICQESQMQLISDIAVSDNESKSSDEDIDESIYNIEHDPGLRSPILSYGVNDQDTVRRAYIALGPCRPKMKACDFPQHNSGGMRRFQPKWFDEFKWLEYSVHKDAAYCFVCYLFKDGDHGKDVFVNEGFRNWNMKDRIRRHAGAIDSAHCEAEEKYNLFIKPKSSIRESFASNTAQYKADYLARLTWSLKCARYLARGCLFVVMMRKRIQRIKGIFESFCHGWQGILNVSIEWLVTMLQMMDHKIQKDLLSACAHETTKFIIEELGDECFTILADESADAYQQEQLALCLRFVNKKGETVERFLGLVHVGDTTALTLKEAIQSLLMKYQLPFSKVRGQGYDGASNMRGHVNGLKKLIMEESPSAYYVHCFAHQLQLTLVAVAKENLDCQWFFGQLTYLLSVLGMSCKKIRMLRIAQAEYMIEALKLGEIETGQGLNQEMGLARPGDTRWGSHYRTTLVKLAGFYPHDFEPEEMNQLPFQLRRYIDDVRNDDNFKNVKGLSQLSVLLVKTGKVLRYDIVYKLLKLVLLLPVATAGVERIFSSMNYIKNKLRSKMGQEYLNDCLVTFVERDFFLQVKDEDIISHFQKMKDRKIRENRLLATQLMGIIIMARSPSTITNHWPISVQREKGQGRFRQSAIKNNNDASEFKLRINNIS
ncbi:LOW QUALITY PROTEIN: hypothetical protein U9M48_028119 [Paspalum notatum var. saurae]|uniref:TTF-type domain-containing protein n=1 Tax=Paspalum notatum var. saurae TaxID=547442 RepID=A0AAQ3X0Q7_PASNO